ncbi:MAG: tRNA 2-thiouridine(34) synthase MnmA [Ruminococcaceae bacterium]|nr:tRNA 2-thiouridine(34) synthase MnmA [Oscillospiraceae bacterium]
MKNICIAMSGGVDSSAAASLVREHFPACGGMTLSMLGGEGDERNAADAAQVCEKLGIAHEAVDCREIFRRQVMEYFADAYAKGYTPNPCVICNREIKFGFLLDEAVKRGYDGVATGHYARICRQGDRALVQKAADTGKDQSYVLAMLSPDQLQRCVFPLGEYTKAQVREIAAERGFVTARKSDSQDICFVPDGDYVGFLTRFTGGAPVPGEYVDESGRRLGMHKGHQCYTIGQRKGLGISMGRHIFVLSKDAVTNRVVLGDEDRLMQTKVLCRDLNLQAADRLTDGYRCRVKLRYAHREADARIWQTEGGILVEFDLPQRAPSPGQFAVLYEDDIVIGGAVIC